MFSLGASPDDHVIYDAQAWVSLKEMIHGALEDFRCGFDPKGQTQESVAAVWRAEGSVVRGLFFERYLPIRI